MKIRKTHLSISLFAVVLFSAFVLAGQISSTTPATASPTIQEVKINELLLSADASQSTIATFLNCDDAGETGQQCCKNWKNTVMCQNLCEGAAKKCGWTANNKNQCLAKANCQLAIIG